MSNRLSGLSLDSRRAVAQLPEDQRECLLLTVVEGYTEEEVAAKIGVSRLAVHRRIKKAHEHLRNILFNR